MSLPPSFGPNYPLLQALYYQQLASLIADARGRRARQGATPTPAAAPPEPTPPPEPPAPAPQPPPQQNDNDEGDEDDEYWDEFNRTLLYLTLMQQCGQPRGPFGSWRRGRF